jgi:hypothetical protein
MSEDTTETTQELVPVIPEETNEPNGTEEIDWKSRARRWETRSKLDRESADKWTEYEKSQKSDHERLAEDLATAKAEASQASIQLLRYKVAAENGIIGEATSLLKGSTLEELESEAHILLSLIADQSKPKSPIPDGNQGKPANAVLGQLTKDDLKGMTHKEVMEAKANGRLKEALGQPN